MTPYPAAAAGWPKSDTFGHVKNARVRGMGSDPKVTDMRDEKEGADGAAPVRLHAESAAPWPILLYFLHTK